MSYETDLILRARELERLLRSRRKLRRQLRAVEGDITHVRKVLKALQYASEGRRPDIAPSRLDAGATGYVPAAVEAEPDPEKGGA